MKPAALSLLLFLLIAGCSSNGTAPGGSTSLVEARRAFKTTPSANKGNDPVPPAPPNIFRTLKYPSPAGELAAYLSPDPEDGKKHPAIIWITGGDCNSIGDLWHDASPDNDQTAAAYRKAGIVMMFPSLRGGNDNPGTKEGFYGEVDDVLAAAKYLEAQSYVDPKRIYLGGHSTGGTLVLLVAECSDRFRAVFSFGPVDDVAGYGADSGFLPFDTNNAQEIKLRSPGYWLGSVQSPAWIIEGASGTSNVECLRNMKRANTNSLAHFVEVPGKSHFSVLAPVNDIIAKKILQDTGTLSNISLTEDDVKR